MVINIVMPGTHLSRLKDNRGMCQQSQRHLDIVLSFGTVKTTPTSQRLEQGDSLGKDLLQEFVWHFKSMEF